MFDQNYLTDLMTKLGGLIQKRGDQNLSFRIKVDSEGNQLFQYKLLMTELLTSR